MSECIGSPLEPPRAPRKVRCRVSLCPMWPCQMFQTEYKYTGRDVMTVRKTTLSHIVSLLFLPRFLGGCRGTRFHYFRAPFDSNNGVVMSLLIVCFFFLQRPPSSSLSYGPGNDDVRSPGSGGTPGPLSQPPGSQQSVDANDPG